MADRRFAPRDLGRLACALNVAALLGLALWFRVTSLEAFPEPNGDEAWYGVQAGHLVRGLPFSPRTGNGNLVNPFHVGFEVLLLLVFKPALWILRISAVVGGVAAVGLTYPLMSRALDRTTALIATVLLGVLPIAILYSRIGYDCSQTPLFSLLALACAFRGRGGRMLLAFALCLVAHPSNVFLMPTLLLVYLAGEAQAAWPARDRRRAMRALAAGSGLVLLVLAEVLYQRRMAHDFYAIRSYDVLRYLKYFGRLFLAGRLGTARSQDVLFWGIALAVLVPGAWRLARDRCWTQLALLAGLGASLACNFAVVGSFGFHPEANRYGLFIVVPAVVAVACLARRSLVAPAARPARVAALLAVGWALLVGFDVNRFDPDWLPMYFTLNRPRPPAPAREHARESPWSIRTDQTDPKVKAIRVIFQDLDRAPRPQTADGRPAVTAIVAQNWWLYRPLQFLAVDRKDLNVVDHTKVPCLSPQQYVDNLRDQLLAGAYVVSFTDQFLEAFVKDVTPPGSIRRWEIRHAGVPYITVLRLKDGREGVRRADVAGPRVVLGTPPDAKVAR